MQLVCWKGHKKISEKNESQAMLAKNLRQKLRQHKRVYSWPHSRLVSEQIMVPQRQTYVSRTEQVDTVADRVVDTTVDRLSILSHSEILQDLFI